MLKIPDYIYSTTENKDVLSQGDVIKPTEKIVELFKNFYPKIEHEPPLENKLIVVRSQCCNLYRSSENPSRQPKITHIEVGLAKPIDLELEKMISKSSDKFKKLEFGYFTKAKKIALVKSMFQTLNNTNHSSFFLPNPVSKDKHFVLKLDTSYSFRTSHYRKFLEGRIRSLSPIFRAKLGYIIANYYLKVATPDLLEIGLNPLDINQYINEKIDKTSNLQVFEKDPKSFLKSLDRPGEECFKDEISASEVLKKISFLSEYRSLILATTKAMVSGFSESDLDQLMDQLNQQLETNIEKRESA